MKGKLFRKASVIFLTLTLVFSLLLAPGLAYANTPPNPGAGDICAIYVDGTNDVGYTSLSDALNAAAPGATIYLLVDVTEAVDIIVAAGDSLTLDLKSFNLSLADTGYISVLGDLVILNGGTLSNYDSFAVTGGSLDASVNLVSTSGNPAVVTQGSADATIVGNVTSNNIGVQATDSGTIVSITGNIDACGFGVDATNSAQVEVVGSITVNPCIVSGYSGTGERSIGAYARRDSKVTVIGDIAANGVMSATLLMGGILATWGGQVTQVGNITTSGEGIASSDGTGTKVTVTGNVSASYTGVTCRAAEVIVNGDIVVTNTSSTYYIHGILAWAAGAQVTVNGNITAIATAGACAVAAAYESVIVVNGNIRAESPTEAIGIEAHEDSRVTLDGDISAPIYIAFLDYNTIPQHFVITAADHDAISNKAGYLQYSYTFPDTQLTAYVWVYGGQEIESDSETGTSIPAAGDTNAALFGLCALLMIASLGALWRARRGSARQLL
ncbi:MAG: hypothetical protein FWE41_03470 [Coriobacteriia bacterium]|nr:hypothetical protein [Coriobacteriia bacterium]MCL2749719.1 hypothetical protein [Coriobacteriia bacterium]